MNFVTRHLLVDQLNGQATQSFGLGQYQDVYNNTSFQTQWLRIEINTITSSVLVKLINITMLRAPETT